MSIETTYDAPYPVVSQLEKMKETMEKVRTEVEHAFKEKDPELAFAVADGLVYAQKVSGISLAMFFSEVEDRWDWLDGEYDDFEDYVYNRLNYSTQTVRKYIALWREIFLNPTVSEGQKEILYGFPMRRLLLIVPAAKEGSLERDHWKQIVAASTDNEIREIILEVRGEQKSASNALRIYLGSKGKTRGQLSVRRGSSGKKTVIGYLNVDSDDKDTLQAIARLMNSAGIVQT